MDYEKFIMDCDQAGMAAVLLNGVDLSTDAQAMDAIREVEFAVGKRARIEYLPRHPADVLATWADIGKAEQMLGWRPRVKFGQGVEKVVEWYRINRDWARNIETG